MATSAVREASNADTFLDRVYIATGLKVEVIGTPEESRLTVSAVRQAVGDALGVNRGEALIADVGGGSTLLTLLEDGEIVTSQSLRLGSIRLQEMFSTSEESPRALGRAAPLPHRQRAGGDAELAAAGRGAVVRRRGRRRPLRRPADRQAHRLGRPGRRRRRPSSTSWSTAASGARAEELAKRYGLPFAEAETLNPALLVYQNLLRLTQATQMIVSHVSMRDGLLLELARAVTGQEDRSLAEGVIHSAMAIAEKYRVDLPHAQPGRRAGRAAVRRAPAGARPGGRGTGCCLQVAGLLHEIGGFVSNRSHHKHSYYLIANSEIFGLNREEITLVAHVARYHRRSGPKPSHLEYMALPREARVTVNKLAALLRVADALARGHVRQRRRAPLRAAEATT